MKTAGEGREQGVVSCTEASSGTVDGGHDTLAALRAGGNLPLSGALCRNVAHKQCSLLACRLLLSGTLIPLCLTEGEDAPQGEEHLVCSTGEDGTSLHSRRAGIRHAAGAAQLTGPAAGSTTAGGRGRESLLDTAVSKADGYCRHYLLPMGRLACVVPHSEDLQGRGGGGAWSHGQRRGQGRCAARQPGRGRGVQGRASAG